MNNEEIIGTKIQIRYDIGSCGKISEIGIKTKKINILNKHFVHTNPVDNKYSYFQLEDTTKILYYTSLLFECLK